MVLRQVMRTDLFAEGNSPLHRGFEAAWRLLCIQERSLVAGKDLSEVCRGNIFCDGVGKFG